MLLRVRIGMTVGGDVRGRPSSPPDIVAEARRAEEDGFSHCLVRPLLPGL